MDTIKNTFKSKINAFYENDELIKLAGQLGKRVENNISKFYNNHEDVRLAVNFVKFAALGWYLSTLSSNSEDFNSDLKELGVLPNKTLSTTSYSGPMTISALSKQNTYFMHNGTPNKYNQPIAQPWFDGRLYQLENDEESLAPTHRSKKPKTDNTEGGNDGRKPIKTDLSNIVKSAENQQTDRFKDIYSKGHLNSHIEYVCEANLGRRHLDKINRVFNEVGATPSDLVKGNLTKEQINELRTAYNTQFGSEYNKA